MNNNGIPVKVELPEDTVSDLAAQTAALNAMTDTANGAPHSGAPKPMAVVQTQAQDTGQSIADPKNFIARWVWVRCPFEGFEELEVEVNAYFNPAAPMRTMLTTGELDPIFRNYRGMPFPDTKPWDATYPGAALVIGWLANKALQEAVLAFSADPTSGTE